MGAPLKLRRDIFRNQMAPEIKKAFMILIQKHPCLSQSDRDFVCDNIHNFETISDASREDVLDVIDSMELFVAGMSPHII